MSYQECFQNIFVKAGYDLFPPTLVWALGVYLFTAQHFSYVVTSFSKIVALTFKVSFYDQVWSYKVAMFACSVQFIFPLLFVGAFLIDEPSIFYNGNHTEWRNKPLKRDYQEVRSLVLSISSGVTAIALVLAILKRVTIVFHRTTERSLYSSTNGMLIHTVSQGVESANISMHINSKVGIRD
uniref:Serpentine receptor class gamma n=1 Tax=Heterorhabditis bacteriophora TaxID=37862 RepID=A0A1I7X4U5_HETBA